MKKQPLILYLILTFNAPYLLSMGGGSSSLEGGTKDSSSLPWAVSTRQGKRPNQEDAYIIKFVDSENAFFAIYDGHRGRHAAQLAAEKLHNHFLARLHEKSSISASLNYAFEQIDKEISDNSGTTAVVSFFTPDDRFIHLGWVGDSRVIVVRDGKVVYETQDHKPDFEGEKIRIESTGGRIRKIGVPRIDSLAISRTLGDHDIKKYHPGAIIVTPQNMSFKLEENDTVIMASDGLLVTLSSQDVGQAVKKMVPIRSELTEGEQAEDKGSDETLKELVRTLRDRAYEAGSNDNITVMAFKLKHTSGH
ncbi:MAG: PP2C family protein-serine/threonine phosphatase [bacterium]|nr:PP2C family protein-serine/threonine phosphatase [bacterium]